MWAAQPPSAATGPAQLWAMPFCRSCLAQKSRRCFSNSCESKCLHFKCMLFTKKHSVACSRPQSTVQTAWPIHSARRRRHVALRCPVVAKQALPHPLLNFLRCEALQLSPGGREHAHKEYLGWGGAVVVNKVAAKAGVTGAQTHGKSGCNLLHGDPQQ
jgi:hypothetical protein